MISHLSCLSHLSSLTHDNQIRGILIICDRDQQSPLRNMGFAVLTPTLNKGYLLARSRTGVCDPERTIGMLLIRKFSPFVPFPSLRVSIYKLCHIYALKRVRQQISSAAHHGRKIFAVNSTINKRYHRFGLS